MADDIKEQKNDENDAGSPVVDELTQCQKLRDEYLAGWQRARADFINYQKQESERITHILQFSREDLISDILTVMDSFDLASANVHSEPERKSYELIRSQLMNILKKSGLDYVKAEVGGVFDPTQHEVVETVKTKDGASQAIGEVVSRGYALHGKVIRAARVKINE